MLWYGFIYYIVFMFLSFISTMIFFRLFYLNIFLKFNIYNVLVKYVLSFFVYFAFLALTTLYYLLDMYANLFTYYSSSVSSTLFLDYVSYSHLLNIDALNLNLVAIYYFPFIYIFITITLLSVLFCLSYNVNELSGFMFYCLVILLSGYLLFFTDSLILFFFAYEMLLVPSFFILYNFAKTRRCVEAAYLMFF